MNSILISNLHMRSLKRKLNITKGKFVSLPMVKLFLIFIASLRIVNSIYIMIRATLNTLKDQ